jgi:hypothetical protein
MDGITTALISLATLALGWFLNWLARQFQLRRDRRAVIGRALSNLLELRHRIMAVETALGAARKYLTVPDVHVPILRSMFEQLFPEDEQLVARYEGAIDQLSETDPVTAFEFRSKSFLSEFFTRWRRMAISQGPPPPELEVIERQLRQFMIPKLNESVIALARLHGRSTRRKVEAIVTKPFEFPSDLQRVLDDLRKRHPSASRANAG